MSRIVFISGPCGTLWDLQRAQAYALQLEAEGLLVYMPQLTCLRGITPEQCKRIDTAWLEKADAVLELGGAGFCYESWKIAPFRLFYANQMTDWTELLRFSKGPIAHDGYQPIRARETGPAPENMHGSCDGFGGSDFPCTD